jgi:hypothetical protein
MAAVPSHGGEGPGRLYSVFKNSVKVQTQGTSKVLVTATDLATYIVEQFYDGDQGQGQRADLIAAIATACGLYKGGI